MGKYTYVVETNYFDNTFDRLTFDDRKDAIEYFRETAEFAKKVNHIESVLLVKYKRIEV